MRKYYIDTVSPYTIGAGGDEVEEPYMLINAYTRHNGGRSGKFLFVAAVLTAEGEWNWNAELSMDEKKQIRKWVDIILDAAEKKYGTIFSSEAIEAVNGESIFY